MSSAVGTETEIADRLRRRLNAGLRQIAFFIVPSAMAFFALGDVITAALYEHGKFTHENSQFVWGIVAGSAVGVLASPLGRLYASPYYALRDTRTPLRYAVIRVALTTVLGFVCALYLPGWIGVAPRWGAAGLTASAGFAGWGGVQLLGRGVNPRSGAHGGAGGPGSEVVGLSSGWGCGWLGDQARAWTPSPDCGGRRGSGALRTGLFRNDLVPWGGGMRRRVPEIGAAAAITALGVGDRILFQPAGIPHGV